MGGFSIFPIFVILSQSILPRRKLSQLKPFLTLAFSDVAKLAPSLGVGGAEP
jgi:hypothetical protein